MRTKTILTLFCASVATGLQATPQYGPGYGYGPGSMGMPGAYEAGPSGAELSPMEEESPAGQLRDGVNKLLGFMRRDEQPSEEELARFLDQEIAPFFDFTYMGQVVAGGLYRQMSEEQRNRLTERLQEQFLTALAQRLVGFDNQDVRFLASRLNRDGRTGSASIAVLNPNTYPARIDFRFYRSPEGWKVFDVSANGQSAVAYYRREFRQMMRFGPYGTPRAYGYRPPMAGMYR